jgi:hypothetical protein
MGPRICAFFIVIDVARLHPNMNVHIIIHISTSFVRQYPFSASNYLYLAKLIVIKFKDFFFNLICIPMTSGGFEGLSFV